MRLLLLTALVIAAATSFAQDASKAIAGDPKLQAHVTHDYQAISFKDLIEDFAKATGAKMRAADTTASDMVILSVKDKSYAEVMLKLAKHFNFTWEERKSGYYLGQTPAAKKRETTLRNKQELGRIQPLRDYLKKEAKLSQDEMDKLKDKYRKWLDAQPKVDWNAVEKLQGQPDRQQTPEEKAWYAWLMSGEDWIGERALPDRMAIARFLAGCTESVWRELCDGYPISFCTAPRALQYSLPSEWVYWVREWLAMAPDKQPFDKAMRDTYGMHIGPGFVPEFTALAPDASPDAVAIVSLVVFCPGHKRQMPDATLIAMDAARRRLYSVHYRILNQDVLKPKPEPPAPDYSKDPILGQEIKPPQQMKWDILRGDDAQGKLASLAWAWQEGAKLEPLDWYAAPVRSAIADAAGESLISDAFDYSTDPYGMMQKATWGQREGLLAGQQLDALKRDCGQDWEVKDGWITLRTTEYAYWRPRQMPRNVLRALIEVAFSKREPTIDEMATIVSGATELQFSSMSVMGNWMTPVPLALSTLMNPVSRAVLRAWESLGQPQRQALQSGQPMIAVPGNSLLRDPLTQAIRAYSVAKSGWASGPADGDAASATTDFETVSEPFDWTEYVPERSRALLALSLEATGTNGFYFEHVSEDGRPYLRTSASPTYLLLFMRLADYFGEDFGNYRFGRETVDTYRFRIHLTERAVVPAVVSATRTVPKSTFGPSDLPDDVKELQRKWHEQDKGDSPGG